MDKCIKGMTQDTCPFNPILGCDCGQNKPKGYKLGSVDTTEEMILNTEWPSLGEPALGWRHFRINYNNEAGHSNIEGNILFPPDVDPYPLLDYIENYFNDHIRKNM